MFDLHWVKNLRNCCDEQWGEAQVNTASNQLVCSSLSLIQRHLVFENWMVLFSSHVMANPWAEIRDRLEIRTFCWLQPRAARCTESIIHSRKDFNHGFLQPGPPPGALKTSAYCLHCLIYIQTSGEPTHFPLSFQDKAWTISSPSGKLKITLAQSPEYSMASISWLSSLAFLRLTND